MNKDPVTETVDNYDKVAEKYVEYHEHTRKMTAYGKDFIKQVPGKKVLDVGCGPGWDAKLFSNHGLDVMGIDLSKEFIRIAETKSPKSKFLQMDMRKLEFSTAYFDGVWASASVLHVPRKEIKKVLSEVYRVLKPNGLLYISVKSGDGAKFVNNDLGINRYFVYYSEKEFKELLTAVGFSIQRISTMKYHDEDWQSFFAIRSGK
jgi:ubiquinone/menaquinone biosynthesis C-methylase UbiE